MSYQHNISRRQSLKWLASLTAVAAGSNTLAQAFDAGPDWPQPILAAIDAPGYGQDPDLIAMQHAPWPLTLSQDQLNLVAVLADIIVPAEGNVPSATAVGVPAVIDEWVSAPYPDQQRDRALLLPGLLWLDLEAKRRFNRLFVAISAEQQVQIIDPIASTRAASRPAEFFARLRALVAGAFYSSPAGMEDLGYIGNMAIAGDYPGPSEEAMTHLHQQLKTLGLELPPS